MSEHLDCVGGMGEVIIDGKRFLVCSEALYKDASLELSGEFHAWCFFAYDNDINIYPANAVPTGIAAQESIAGASADSESGARAAVAEILENVIRTRCLDGTGFYCPASDMTYPQDLTSKDKRKSK